MRADACRSFGTAGERTAGGPRESGQPVTGQRVTFAGATEAAPVEEVSQRARESIKPDVWILSDYVRHAFWREAGVPGSNAVDNISNKDLVGQNEEIVGS